MTRYAPAYREAVIVALVLQAVLMLFLAILLDGGNLAKAGLAALIGFWAGVAIVLHRRPRMPTDVDLLYVRWGYLAVLIVAIAVSPWMGALRRLR